MKKILILAANPKDTSRLRLDQEVREIDNGLQRAKRRDEFILKPVLAARPADVRRAMLDLKPNVVHFCGHGSGEAGIAFEDESGNTKLVNADALEGFFELFADTVECVVLNACYSKVQAEAIAKHIGHVIGMNSGIGDNAAIEFAVAFYDALGVGESFEFAYKLARNAIQWSALPENLTPILIKKSQAKPMEQQLPKIASRKVSLQAWNGKYVCAIGGGGGEVFANRKQIDESAKFDLIELGDNNVAFRTQNGDLVCAESGGGREIVASRRKLGEWETFKLDELKDNRITLRTHIGQYVSVEKDGTGTVVATRPVRDESAVFKLIQHFETEFLPIPLFPGIGNSYLRDVYLDPPLGDVILEGVKFRLEPNSLIFDTNGQIRYYAPRPDGSKEIELRLREPVDRVKSVFLLINSGNSKRIYASEKIGEIVLLFEGAPPLVTELILGANIREWCLGHPGDWVREASSPACRVAWRGMSKDGVHAVIDCLQIPVYESMRNCALEKIIFVHKPTHRPSDTLGVQFFVSAVSLEIDQPDM